MAWQMPRLNYTNDSYFEISDYNRIKGNAQYVESLLQLLRGSAPKITVYNIDEGDVPLAQFYTDTEKAAADLRNAALNANETYNTYKAYDKVWDFKTLNKTERLLNEACILLEAEADARKTLSFSLNKEGYIFEP